MPIQTLRNALRPLYESSVGWIFPLSRGKKRSQRLLNSEFFAEERPSFKKWLVPYAAAPRAPWDMFSTLLGGRGIHRSCIVLTSLELNVIHWRRDVFFFILTPWPTMGNECAGASLAKVVQTAPMLFYKARLLSKVHRKHLGMKLLHLFCNHGNCHNNLASFPIGITSI